MKKFTFLVSAFALFAGTMSAATLQVTSPEMNAATEGSLLNVMANIPDGELTTIEFNFDGETLDYSAEECIGFKLSGKQVVFDGINKKNNTMVTIKGNTNFLALSGTADVTVNNLKLTGFKGIAFTTGDGTKLTLNDCVFDSNRDPKNEKGNNGSVVRAGGGDIVVDGCLFEKNKAMGSYGGGAVCLYQSSATAPSLKVVNSTFHMNEAVSGGAIAVNVRSGKGSVPTVYIANCTFANNTINDRGGALYMQTAETAGVFKPVIVNNTFVGNITNIVTSDDGGAINLWSRATTSMEPVLINNLFAENYFDPWGDSRLNDVKAFYLGGEIVGDAEQPQTVKPVCKNNYFAASEDSFYKALKPSDNNALIDFSSDKIFAATEQNPWDEGDPEYSHMTAVLSGDLKVAMIDEASVVIGKGLASYDGVEIPTTDQLGNARPATPAVGAVEYTEQSSVNEVAAEGTIIAKQGNNLVVNGEATTLTIFNMTGCAVKTVAVEAGAAVSVADLQAGLYIAKAGNSVLKFVK